MKRRAFLRTTTLATFALGSGNVFTTRAATARELAAQLPRWRGFNLTEKFIARPNGNPAFPDSDFALLHEWGFDFARLPMSYLCWSSHEDMRQMREPELKHLDEAVASGQKHQVHICFNLHRAPGYCVNPPREPLDLWKDEKALDACAFQWSTLARRFKGVPAEKLSFDLLNEPANVSEEDYTRVVKRLVQAIRAEDSQRLIIADGLHWGREPVFSLVDLNIAQSTRGYDPMQVSHHQANWVQGSGKWPTPTWPMKQWDGKMVDKAFLKKDRIEPWQKLERKGVGIHVGEWGAHNRTPHDVTLAWMRDQLALWRDAGWGWALWNLRGSFGVLESGRSDVPYEDFRGHKLDRKMLEVLQAG
ncbi:MAG TPA: cellulase family glycosylhydrolase [Verrucomicrobiae bacterium]|nr:cellulase family glycosylhydrolase [Verrucomicrobiae bacterium]